MKVFKTLRQILHAMVGQPDYERYVDHLKSCHPDQTALSYEDFYKLAQARRYSGTRARCC
jgi:uncharacterized short protein YbdD (DUF466 family)